MDENINKLVDILTIAIKLDVAGRLHDQHLLETNEYNTLLVNAAAGVGLIDLNKEGGDENE